MIQKDARGLCRDHKVEHRSNLNAANCFYGSEREVRLFAFVFLKDMQPRFLFQLKSMGILRFARANQSLPFRRSSDIFDVRSVTVGQAEVFYEVLYVAVWTFYIKTSLEHCFRHRSKAVDRSSH